MRRSRDLGAHSVIDLGCGSGPAARRAAAQPGVHQGDRGRRVVAVVADRRPPAARSTGWRSAVSERLTLFQACADLQRRSLAGYDAAVLMEVIEHVDPPGWRHWSGSCSASAAPGAVIVTTPNVEYNVNYPSLGRPAAPRPPLRVDPGGVLGLVRPCLRGARLPRRAAVVWARSTTTSARRPRWGCSAVAEVRLPELGLVLLVGVSGSGKSTFGAKHFLATQVISSDFCRALVSDDETDQSATKDAFDVLHYLVGTRLRRGLLTVVDATNVQRDARAGLIALARSHDVLVDAIVLDVPESTAIERNLARPDRAFGSQVISRQRRDLKRSIGRLRKEGFRRVHELHGVEEIDAAEVTYEKSWNDKRELTGPFDLIGDVHGCRAELETLLGELGYRLSRDAQGRADRRDSAGGPDRGVRGRSGRPRPGHSRRAAPGDGDGGRGQRAVRLGQPRGQAGPGPARGRGEGRSRTRRVAGTARRGDAGVPGGCPRLHGWPDQPLRAGRRPAGGGARRTQGGLPRAGLRPGSRVRAVRRHDRGDRRVRTAGALSLGSRLPRRSDGRLRAHAGAGAGVGEQHDLSGHRCRVRRLAHGAALPRAGARLGAGGAGVVRTGSAARARADRARALGARHRRRERQPLAGDGVRRAGQDPGGERRRRPGGDEPVRRRPALAGLPAAHDVAVLHLPTRRVPGAPRAGLRRVRRCRRHRGRLRGEAHGLARDRRDLRRRGHGRPSLRVSDGSTGAVYTRTGRAFFPDTETSDGSARRAPTFSSRWRPSGWCSTASSCRGRPRRWD